MSRIFKLEMANEYKLPRQPNFLLPENENAAPKIPVGALTEEQASVLADLIREDFMRHWRARREQYEGKRL